ncbi:MAG TPA: shikimate kinase [Blastocatellia bacterium]|nr:shikimate kinase [Blastocatellia bacterium]
MKGEPDAPIFLIGFMGAGKTTVGRVLAEKLGFHFVDLDEIVEANAGRSVRAIFAELGEGEFRRLEREALEHARAMKHTVIALGGGAYISNENRAIIDQTGEAVWLDCPLEICLSRIERDSSRPLLAGETEMKALLDRRRPFYALADHVVSTGDCTAAEAAQRVLDSLNEKTIRAD